MIEIHVCTTGDTWHLCTCDVGVDHAATEIDDE